MPKNEHAVLLREQAVRVAESFAVAGRCQPSARSPVKEPEKLPCWPYRYVCFIVADVASNDVVRITVVGEGSIERWCKVKRIGTNVSRRAAVDVEERRISCEGYNIDSEKMPRTSQAGIKRRNRIDAHLLVELIFPSRPERQSSCSLCWLPESRKRPMR